MHATELYIQNSQPKKNLQMYPVTVSWHKKVQIARSEHLIQEADPHITKRAIEARM